MHLQTITASARLRPPLAAVLAPTGARAGVRARTWGGGAVRRQKSGARGKGAVGPLLGAAAGPETARGPGPQGARALGPEGTLCMGDGVTGASNQIILCLKDPVFSRHQALYQTQFFYVLNSKLGKTMYPRCLVLDVAY